MPLELEFVGNFFSLADFFHDIKRFVRVANENVVVSGRLITIDGVSFSSDTELFPRLTAEVTATVYLSPKAEGATAGATPQGPAPTTTPAAQPTPASVRPPPRRPLPRPPPRPPKATTMKIFLLDLWHDLREKRLWPVAVVLAVGLVAVPVVLSKPSAAPPAPAVEQQAAHGA